MTDRELLELAREAGFNTDRGMIWVEGWEISPFMQRFAALVRNAVLEEAIDLVAFHGGSVEIEAAIRALKERLK